jgi:hypothetical protein
VEELNFAARAVAKLRFKILKYLEKTWIAEFGTPFA